MSVTVNTLYLRCCDVMLEPGGLICEVLTPAQFLDLLAGALLDLTQRSGLVKRIYTQRIIANQVEYSVPDLITQPQLCFVGGKLIERTTRDDLDRKSAGWAAETGPPRQWYEDGLDVKKIALVPKPNYSGAVNAGTYGRFSASERNLTIVGPTAPLKTSWTLDDTLDGVPDSLCNYLVYGVLEKVFGAEAETRDVQRAFYCRTRWQEALLLADAIRVQELCAEDDEE